MRKQKGFSLIELLIVVAIILIIAAIAIPNLLRSRMAANEASAVGSVRTLNTAEVTYASTYPSTGFASLGALGGTAPCVTPTAAAACIIDPVLAGGAKSGYSVGITTENAGALPNTGFVSVADAQTYGTTGTREFCGIASGVIYYAPGTATFTAPTTDAVCVASPFLPLQ